MENKKDFKLNWQLAALITILLIAAGIRLYFFNVYKNQPVWWDESEHLVMAKHIAFDSPKTGWNASREILLPLIFAAALKIFNSEVFLRFLQIVFSFLVVLFTYLVGKEIFNKNIGLIAAFLMSIYHLQLFWSIRFGLEILGPLFATAAIFFFWKGYVKKEKGYYIIIAGALGALALMTSAKTSLVALALFFSLIFSDKFQFLKNKQVWLTVLVAVILFSPYAFYYKNTTGSFLPRAVTTAEAVTGQLEQKVWSWSNFLLFSTDLVNQLTIPLFIVFLIGLVYALISIVLGFDLMFKGEKESAKFFFILLWMLFPLLTFSYFLGITPGGYPESRFLLEGFPAIFMLTAIGFERIYDWIKGYRKEFAVFVILAILFVSAFLHLRIASATINARAPSFLQVKEAAFWMKERSSSEDWIITNSVPQTTYYAERQVWGVPGDWTEEQFNSEVKKLRPKFLVISVFEFSPQWYYDWSQRHENSLQLVQAYTTQQNGQERPLLLIYQFINYDF